MGTATSTTQLPIAQDVFMTALVLSGVIGGAICGAIPEFMRGIARRWLMIVTGLPALPLKRVSVQ